MSKEENGNKTQKDNPEKYFNPDEYNTINVGSEKPVRKALDPIEELLDLLRSRVTGEKDSALSILKKENTLQLLLDGIANSRNSKDKALLVAAIWESGLDIKGNYEFFARLVHDEDLFVSMEAITVLEENLPLMQKKDAENVIKLLEPSVKDHFNAQLIEDLILRLKQL
jgi:hypothetical protein